MAAAKKQLSQLAASLSELRRSVDGIKSNMEAFKLEVKRDMSALKRELKKEFLDELEAMRQEMSSQRRRSGDETVAHVPETDGGRGREEEMEKQLTQTDRVVSQLERQMVGLRYNLLDLQAKQLRNSIRVFNCPETEKEGTDMADFMGQLLRTQLNIAEGDDLQIASARRVFTREQRDATAPPRHIVINFHKHATKQMVLKKAWAKEVKMSGRRLGFDNEYPPEVVRQRREYAPLKRVLKQEKISFQSPFTKLRVHWIDGVKLYSNAAEAEGDLRARGLGERTAAMLRERGGEGRSMDAAEGTASARKDVDEPQSRHEHASDETAVALPREMGEGERDHSGSDEDSDAGKSDEAAASTMEIETCFLPSIDRFRAEFSSDFRELERIVRESV